MFKNRVFNIAFLFSLTWHVVCVSAVNVVILPGKYKARDLTSVSFLGPILEETALEIMLVNKPVAIMTKYRHALKYTHAIAERRESPLSKDRGDEVNIHEAAATEDRMRSALAMSIRTAKETPGVIRKRGRRYAPVKPSGSISGSLAGREVIFRPKQPELPSWIDASSPYVLEFELSVSAQGEVSEVVPVVSSGNPEVDLLGIRYMKGWKFVPLAHGTGAGQNGRIKLVFAAQGNTL